MSWASYTLCNHPLQGDKIFHPKAMYSLLFSLINNLSPWKKCPFLHLNKQFWKSCSIAGHIYYFEVRRSLVFIVFFLGPICHCQSDLHYWLLKELCSSFVISQFDAKISFIGLLWTDLVAGVANILTQEAGIIDLQVIQVNVPS